jgi:hypothetical protein
VADVALCVRLAVKMVEMRAAGLAGMMDVIVAIGRDKTVAF